MQRRLKRTHYFDPQTTSSLMNEQDYIIVGQGVAGSLLAYFLRKNGQKVVIFDNYTEGSPSSSQIAAGVINPITGRRFVKSWRIDELIPSAKRTYQELETLLNIPIWHDRRIVRTLSNAEEENNFLLRKTYPDYQHYCGETTDLAQQSAGNHAIITQPYFNKFYAFAETLNGAQVNLPLLVAQIRAYFVDNQSLINESFSPADLVIGDDSVVYKNWKAKKIIFAEGAAGAENPFFSWLPFNLDKGELLLVRIPDLNLKAIFKHKISIVPLHDVENAFDTEEPVPIFLRESPFSSFGKNLYWVGATNAWNFETSLPTESNKQLIINELCEILNCPFEVVAHQAAVRPTVRDRRPFVGLHPKYPTLGIFNGFGTKGASLAPFFAEQFVNNLLRNVPLEKEIDISRFRFDK
jgi:glycine oxidase